MNNFQIRQATSVDHSILTEISFESKRMWNYPDAYFEIWHDELTITPEYIDNHFVYLAETDNRIIGYYSLVINEKDRWVGDLFLRQGLWLDHMFVRPKFTGQRVGKALMNHAKNLAASQNHTILYLLADPNAKGFYEKQGCTFDRDVPSNIPDRTVSLFYCQI